MLGRHLDGVQQLIDFLCGRFVAIPTEAHVALVDGAHGLAEGFLEVACQSHGLAHGLHGGGQCRIGTRELFEGETRNLGDHVVDGRLEAGRSGLRDIVLDFVERVAKSQFGGDLRNREAGCLGCQSGGTGHTRVHFDDNDASSVRVNGELDVAAASIDAHATNDGDADITKLLILAIGQSEHRRHGNGIAGVHTDRIHVLNRADDHDVVFLVAHQLEFVFLPAFDAFFNQHLVGWGIMDACACDAVQFLFVVRDAGTKTTHGEARSHNQWIAELLSDLIDLFEGMSDVGTCGFSTSLINDLLEELTVLTTVDGFKGSANQLDVVLLEHTGLTQRHGCVQCSLTA